MTQFPILTWERFKDQYAFVTQPGTYNLKVRSVSRPVDSNSKLNTGGTARIVNFFAVPDHSLEYIKDLRKESPEGVELEQLNGLTMTFNIESNTSQEVPAKGEMIKAVVETYVPTGENALHKGEEILVIRSISVPQAVNAAKNWDQIFGVTEEPKVEEEVTAFDEGEEAF
jgi:hypothetical protein